MAIDFKLTGSLAFCGLLVYLGVWKDIGILTFFGTVVGLLIVIINLIVGLSERYD